MWYYIGLNRCFLYKNVRMKLIVFRLSFRIKKVLKGKSYDLEPDPQKGRAEPGMQKALLIKSQISITKIIVK